MYLSLPHNYSKQNFDKYIIAFIIDKIVLASFSNAQWLYDYLSFRDVHFCTIATERIFQIMIISHFWVILGADSSKLSHFQILGS